jgi:hypothetical protein
MTGTSTATAEVARLIEHRLEQIEEQLRPFTELEDERRRLRDALGVLRAGETASDAPTRSTSPRGRVSQPRRRRARAGKRAPRGSNLSAIVDHVAAHPGATAGSIASATGISRGVVYSATSRLASAGRLVREPRPDGQVGYRTA